MDERIKAIENLLRILAVNHNVVIKSNEPANVVIEVIDFIRQFSANLSNELSGLKQQATTKQDAIEVIDNEPMLQPSVGNAILGDQPDLSYK